MPIKGLTDKKTKYKDLTKNRTVLYVTVVPFWYSRSFDDACFFFYVSSCAIHNFTSDLLAYSQNSAYRKAWFKTKLLFKEKIGQIWRWTNQICLSLSTNTITYRPQSIWGNETRIYCNCMDHQITAWARWPNISAYKMYFPTNLYLGQPLRWR